MNASTIEQLGLSAASTRVLQAQLESSLSGTNFKIGLATAYVLTAIFWSVSLGVIVLLAGVATREGEPVLFAGALFTLPFILIPWLVLRHMRRLDRARRGV